MKPTLIIDADDTLWENNIHYEQCTADFAELMAAQGFEREAAERMADAVERERVPVAGYAPEEFAHSLVIAYQRLCERYDRSAENAVSDGVWEIGQRVVAYPIALLDGVEETLALLSGHCRLLLLTKGDREVQEGKVARSGLGHFFEAVHVVPEKDAQVLRELTVEYGLQPERTWMVGNSPRSDINPALETGIGAIYIPHPNTWNLEVEEIVKPEGTTVLKGFAELAGLFPKVDKGEIMSEYEIRPYDPADNAGLAVMLNESDDQWPGTFTEGVPMTEENMRDWVEKETCLVRLVVEAKTKDNPAGKIVGYGTLWQDASQQDTCYVAFLNVHPDHQKRSLARRMLTQMVDWATASGYSRMTIGTWPGNLKSVPLYKKVGFFWTPDTDVYMENYIPTLRQLGIAREFFDRHDWYTTFRRELKQVEDEQRHPATGDMKVYIVRWEQDGEYLEAVVDRQAQALTGLETSEFAAYTVVDESEPAQGIAYPVRWRVVNKRDEPVNVSVLANGETGIDLSHRASFTLNAGEERVLETTFTCAVDAPRLDPDKEKSAPKIKTTLVIGGDVVELGTGLRYRSAVTFTTEPEFPSLLPGRSQTVHVQLRNRARRPLSGTVQIAPQKGLATDWQRHEFELAADGYTGLPLTATTDRDGAIPLGVTATFVDGGQHIFPARVPGQGRRLPGGEQSSAAARCPHPGRGGPAVRSVGAPREALRSGAGARGGLGQGDVDGQVRATSRSGHYPRDHRHWIGVDSGGLPVREQQRCAPQGPGQALGAVRRQGGRTRCTAAPGTVGDRACVRVLCHRWRYAQEA